MSDKKVRVRFAPSPTGPLHIGGVRTALYNYLFAKKHGGDFLLRIEDTDQTRYVENAEEYIIESLKWCNINIDEGQTVGGEYGPYRQSERKPLYREYADKLVNEGNAYIAFDSPEELDKLRNDFEAEKKTFTYNAEVRNNLNNSLALSAEDTKTKIDAGDPYVIRYKMPENEELTLVDIIRGDVIVNTASLDDKVLFKSDGMPTYHLANIVDDYLMKISHVIRGEEWLPSLPLHVLLYRSLGWMNEMPEFAHLPLLLKPNGNGKLSKRDGDKLGFPVFPLRWPLDKTQDEIASGYRESGYFADSFTNMLAFLGWNPGTEQEIFSMDELVEAFSLERVGKSGSKFDPDKAKWFNRQYMHTKDNKIIAEQYLEILKEKNIDVCLEYVERVTELMRERADFVSDLWEQTSYFFESPTEYDAKVVKKKWKEQTPDLLRGVVDLFNSIEDFTENNIETIFKQYLEDNEISFGQIMNSLRLTLVGGGMGPSIFLLSEILGKEEVIIRINNGIQNIKK